MIIYFNKEKTKYQIIRPNQTFDGNWKGLADAITGSGEGKYGYIKNYSHYVIL